MKKTPNDVIFTRKEIAEKLVETIFEKFPKDFKTVINGIEPSAGSGAFVDIMKKYFKNVICMDIDPQRNDILKHDFLLYDFSGILPEESCCIGNPPFSRVKEFLKRCSEISNKIIMILPQGFSKRVPSTCVEKCWKVKYVEMLPSDVFEKNKKIFSCFLYLKKSKPNFVRLRIEPKITPVGFTIEIAKVVDGGGREYDIIYWKSGNGAGKRTYINKITNSSAYGLNFQDQEKKRKVLEENIVIPTRNVTSGRKYISSFDICKIINPL